MSKCLINVEGGLGKNVMLTSILQEFKETKGYDELYVISPYYDVFKCCPAVTDAFPPKQGTLYQELVLDDDCDIYWKDPYNNQRFIKKQCHLFDAWAEEYGFVLKNPADTYTPDLSALETAWPVTKSAIEPKLKEWGKFFIVQFTGGQSPLVPTTGPDGKPVPYVGAQEGIKRNYFEGAKVVELIKKKYPGVTVVHFALPNEPPVEGTVKAELPYLAYRLLAAKAEGIVTIDSSLQHLATGVNNNITVIWGETRPEHFGYACNRNVCAKNVLNSQPYFRPLGISPSIVRMPKPEEVIGE